MFMIDSYDTYYVIVVYMLKKNAGPKMGRLGAKMRFYTFILAVCISFW